MRSSRERLGDLLVKAGLATRPNVEECAAEALRRKRLLGEILVERGACREADVYRALARQYGLRFVSYADVQGRADETARGLIPAGHQERLHILPLGITEAGLQIVTSNPTLNPADLGRLVNGPVELLLMSKGELHRLATGEAPPIEPARPSDSPGVGSQAVTILDDMIQAAILERASDLHLEIYDHRVRVRFRIDGDLVDQARYVISHAEHRGIVNVIKIRAELDITEHRLPQGGRNSVAAGGKVYDLRIQTQPGAYGENVVIRILSPQSTLLTIEQLGFPATLGARYRRLLDTPTGMVLVVGPTGSGKSTTLYAGLQVLAADTTRKVITIEDPIEYAIEGIQQTQVNRAVGFDFADAMRVFVRQDPDVIFVGEIRDTETAREAIRASQTGHLVFSTLHANDTVDAVQRLFDLDMHPNSVASELSAVLAQRLAKRLCAACRRFAAPKPSVVSEVFPSGAPEGFVCYEGAGCERCGGRGTHGRIAVIELLPADEELRRAISRRLQLDDLRAAARKSGLRPFVHHALALVVQGVIALEELPMILSPEALRATEGMESWRPSSA